MPTKPTPLANTINDYTNRAGGNITQALHNLAQDLGLHDCDTRAEDREPGSAADPENPAHARKPEGSHAQRTHAAEIAAVEPIVGRGADAESSTRQADE